MRPGPRQIIAFVAKRLGMTPENITGQDRYRPYVVARSLCMVVLRNRPWLTTEANSYPQIGRHLGGRDHSTVIHSCRTFPERAKRDPDLLKLWWQAAAYASGYPIPDEPEAEPVPIMVRVKRRVRRRPRNDFTVPRLDEDQAHRFHRGIADGSVALLKALQA